MSSDLKIENYKKMPNGQFRGICPYRENHTALGSAGGGAESFFMTPQLNSFHCFSCNAKGRMSVLLREKFFLTLQETLEYVNNFNKLEDISQSLVKKGLKRTATLKEVANNNQQDLIKNLPQKIESDTALLEYFIHRGFDKKTLRFFKVGAIENFKKEDTFYLKVYTMPVYFLNNLVEIWYRANVVFSDTNALKRLWVENKLDNKANKDSKIENIGKNYLYNYDNAATFSKVVICEGQTDCWKIFQALNSSNNLDSLNLGIVATLGTSFTDFQFNLALNTWKEFIFAYDNDLAGMTAALKFASKLIAYGVDNSKIKFYYYTNSSKKDPAEMTEKNILASLENTLTISQYRYNKSSYINHNIN